MILNKSHTELHKVSFFPLNPSLQLFFGIGFMEVKDRCEILSNYLGKKEKGGIIQCIVRMALTSLQIQDTVVL